MIIHRLIIRERKKERSEIESDNFKLQTEKITSIAVYCIIGKRSNHWWMSKPPSPSLIPMRNRLSEMITRI